MDRFQPVARIGERAMHDGRQGIGQIALADGSRQGFRDGNGLRLGGIVFIGHDGVSSLTSRCGPAGKTSPKRVKTARKFGVNRSETMINLRDIKDSGD